MLTLLSENDPRLNTVSDDLEQFDDESMKLIGEMNNIMLAHKGIAMAAPQVGWFKRVITLTFEPYVIVNPVIDSASGKMKFTEGCLSFPNLWLDTERASIVTITYDTPTERGVTTTFRGMQAIVIQHEIDHLNGILFTSKVNPIRLALAIKKRAGRS